MDGVVEIITGRERRRRWSVQDKLRLVAEPGARVRAVAARHGVCESLLFAWRQVHDGVLRAPEMPVFMPVRITGDMLPLCHPVPTHAAPALPSPRLSPGLAAPAPERIEIALADGTCIRVGADVGLAALRRVMAAVRR